MPGSSIRFSEVCKSYGSTEALVDFSLDLAPGEFVTLLGPSGSGKTTALNVLAGFIAPNSGSVEIDGRPMLHLPPERRGLGMVFQSYSLFPHMNIEENLAFPLRLRKLASRQIRQRVDEVLTMVQLPGMNRRMPHELSGGQRQRVAFARAVVAQPSVLLMDEPLGALDLKLREAMQVEIKRIHRQLGCTILFVTHDQGEALAMSDRVVVMNHARIAQVGTPQEIYDRPRTRHVAEFIGTSNVLTIAGDAAGWSLPQLGVEPLAASAVAWQSTATSLSVRPERLSRHLVNAGTVSFAVEVVDVTFLGEAVEYLLRTAPGHEVWMREARDSASTFMQRGQSAVVGFDPRQATALHD